MYIKVYISVLKGYKIGQNKALIVFPPSCEILFFAKSVDPFIPTEKQAGKGEGSREMKEIRFTALQ